MQSLKVRIYIKCAHSLLPSTPLAYGNRQSIVPDVKQSNSIMRPYIQLSIHHDKRDRMSYPGHVFKSHDRHFADKSEPSLNPEFYKMFELDCVLPHLVQLKIDLFDAKSVMGVDELIGSTFVNLDERWNSDAWRGMLEENRVPVEYRTLYHNVDANLHDIGLARGIPQGKLEVWLGSRCFV